MSSRSSTSRSSSARSSSDKDCEKSSRQTESESESECSETEEECESPKRTCKKKKDCNDSCISPVAAYIIWLVILIILIIILRAVGIRWFSTIVFSLVVAWVVLAIIYPVKFENGIYCYNSYDCLYGFITLVTVILLVIYLIWKVFTDRVPKEGEMGEHEHGHGMQSEHVEKKGFWAAFFGGSAAAPKVAGVAGGPISSDVASVAARESVSSVNAGVPIANAPLASSLGR